MHICEYFDVRQIFDPGANGVGREKGRVERGEGINLFWNEFKEATPFYFLSGLQLPSIEKRNDPSTWTKMTCPTPQISHSYSEGIFIILFSVLIAVKQPGYNDRWLVNIQYLLFFFHMTNWFQPETLQKDQRQKDETGFKYEHENCLLST